VPTKGFYLIPFVGGAAVSTREIDNRWTEYLIVMAGPLFGLSSALLPLVLYWLTDYPLLAAVSAWIATINLLNLMPILPLDGGKIVKSIAFSVDSRLGLGLAVLGLLVCAGLLTQTGAGLLAFLLIMGCLETAVQWARRDKFVMPIRGLNFPGAIALYLALAVALLLIVHAGNSVPEGRAALDLLKD
jgi:Zn-dependent protease